MPIPFLPFDDDAIFPCLNVVIVGYVLLLFAPKYKHTPSITLFITFIYSLLYTLLLVHRLFISNEVMPEAKFDSLQAVILLFSDNAVMMAGWTHYVAVDLFVARYAVLDSQSRGIPHYWMFPIVSIILFAAPTGFVLYCVLQQLLGRSPSEKKRYA